MGSGRPLVVQYPYLYIQKSNVGAGRSGSRTETDASPTQTLTGQQAQGLLAGTGA